MKKLFIMLLICSTGAAFAQKNDSNQKTQTNDEKLKLSELVGGQIFKDPASRMEIKNNNPDWKGMARTLQKKYPSAAVTESLVKAKLDFYLAKVSEDWNNYARVWIENVENTVDVDKVNVWGALILGLNGQLYEVIFNKATDKELLLRAAIISNKVVNNSNSYRSDYTKEQNNNLRANLIDTYANLLYKAGKKEEAIEWQTKAIELAKADKDLNAELSGKLVRMKAGKSTWK